MTKEKLIRLRRKGSNDESALGGSRDRSRVPCTADSATGADPPQAEGDADALQKGSEKRSGSRMPYIIFLLAGSGRFVVFASR